MIVSKTLRDLSEVLGRETALQLIASIEPKPYTDPRGWRADRRILYVPSSIPDASASRTVCWDRAVAAIGEEAATKLQEAFAGICMFVPACAALARSRRDDAMWIEYTTNGRTAEWLAAKYGLSQRRVEQILQDCERGYMYGPYSVLPAADCFPLIEGAEFEDLVESISEHGLHHPIVVWNGQIVDGRNRYRACSELGIEPTIVEPAFADEAEATHRAIEANLRRRHLNATQRAGIAYRLREIRPRGRKKQNLAFFDEPPKNSAQEAADSMNVSREAVRQAGTVIEHGIPELVAAIDRGEVAVSAAAEVAKLPPEQQQGVVERGEVKSFAAAQRRKKEGEREAKKREDSVAALTSSESNEHYTPVHILEAARRVLGAIDLDPASCELANTNVKAKHYFTEEDDGINRSWDGRVWLNPPYGKTENESNQGRWLQQLHYEYEGGNVEAACFEVNAAVGAEWFEVVWRSTAFCMIRGRLKHIVPETMAPGPSPTHYSIIGYLGRDVKAFHREFSVYGKIIEPGLVMERTAKFLSEAA